jgi:hypothetical protein
MRVTKAARKCFMLVCFYVGNTVKLREPPKAFTTKLSSKGDSGRANSPGYSNSVKDVTMGNPQPSPKGVKPMDAVQRLDGSGCCNIAMLKV